MTKTIEAWIDFTSPFSYLGMRNLQKALRLTERTDIIIACRTFQIDPEFNPQRPTDLTEFEKYLAEQKKLLNLPQVVPLIEQTGIVFDFKKVVPVNTFNAHSLMHIEGKISQNQDWETIDLIFHAFWTAGIDISNWEMLKAMGASVGLNETVIGEMIDDRQILNEILKDEHEAIDDGVSAIPHFKFPNGDKIQGLMSVEQAIELIKKN